MSGIAEIPYYQFGDSIYVELGSSTWEEAQVYAEKLGGNLVSINSQEEQDFITKTFASIDDGEHAKWIGLTDKEEEGNWEWIDGTTLEFTNWNPNEPSGDGNYGMIWANYGTQLNPIFPEGSWNDVSNNGDGQMSGIVEIKYFGIDTTANLTVNPVNDAPKLTGQQATLENGIEDTSYTIIASDLLQGYSDADGDTLSVDSPATNGSLHAKTYNSIHPSEYINKDIQWIKGDNWEHEAFWSDTKVIRGSGP